MTCKLRDTGCTACVLCAKRLEVDSFERAAGGPRSCDMPSDWAAAAIPAWSRVIVSAHTGARWLSLSGRGIITRPRRRSIKSQLGKRRLHKSKGGLISAPHAKTLRRARSHNVSRKRSESMGEASGDGVRHKEAALAPEERNEGTTRARRIAVSRRCILRTSASASTTTRRRARARRSSWSPHSSPTWHRRREGLYVREERRSRA